MARKYDFISELYNRTCKTVVANPASWEAFLRSACYNYRLRFDEQLLVHAQRPDATAVLQIDDWNQKFGRWVNRGAHGIAVFEDADQRRQRLVHYFDISDTHPSRFSRRVPIWQMRDEYTAEVIDTLESTFGELNDKETLAVAIESAARNAVEDNIPDYLTDLLYSVKDSFLDGVSEEEITMASWPVPPCSTATARASPSAETSPKTSARTSSGCALKTTTPMVMASGMTIRTTPWISLA